MRSSDVLKRLLSKIYEEGECWIYTGYTNGRGDYGRMRVPKDLGTEMGCPGGQVQVHRLSYWLHVGPFDIELVIHHRCHTSRCVNPAHLLPATVNENAIEANDTRWSTVEATPDDDWA